MLKLTAVFVALAWIGLSVCPSFAENADTGNKEIRYEVVVTGNAMCLAYSPDGKYIATGEDGKVVIRDAGSGEILKSIPAETSNIRAMDYSPDGKDIAVCGLDNTVVIMDLVNGCTKAIYNITHTNVYTDECEGVPATFSDVIRIVGKYVKYSPDGMTIAIASKEQPAIVVIVDSSSGNEIRSFDYIHEDSIFRRQVHSLAFSKDGSKLAIGLNRQVDIWSMTSGVLLKTLDGSGFGYHHAASNATVQFDSDDDILTFGIDNTSAKWALNKDVPSWKIVNSNPATPIISREGVTKCSVCHIGHGQRTKVPGFMFSLNNAASISPDGKTIASGGKESAIVIRDARTGKRLRTYPCAGDDNYVLMSLEYCPDGNSIAAIIDMQGIRKLIVYYADYDGGPQAELHNDIQNIIDERDTKINLAYSNMTEPEAAEEEKRLTKEYGEKIANLKKEFEAAQKQAAPAEATPATEKQK